MIKHSKKVLQQKARKNTIWVCLMEEKSLKRDKKQKSTSPRTERIDFAQIIAKKSTGLRDPSLP